MAEYRTYGLVGEKVRQIIVDKNGRTISASPTKE